MAIREVDAAGLEALQAAGNAQIIDVRNDAEVARGVIPGARHIALASIPARFGELDRSRPVVLYCQMGARSMQAGVFLVEQGFDQVVHLAGGVNAWLASGRTIVA
jgi:rhodanese-related sulfurtransferase